MNDWQLQTACEKECLPNCEDITYQYTNYKSNLDVGELCRMGSDTRKVLTFH